MSAYDDMTDEELMTLARTTMLAAAAEKPGSVERAMKFAGHDSVMRELRRRILVHAMRKINEQLDLPAAGPDSAQ